jgi:hypothetical protein
MVFKRFYNYIKWLYMQYLLNTALYMLEPAEIKLFNFLIIFLLFTSIYSTYVFLPGQVLRILQWATSSSNNEPFSSIHIEN